jgi:ribose transport system substrate-binding protein
MSTNKNFFGAIAIAVALSLSSASFAKDIVLAIIPAGMDSYGSAAVKGFTEEAEALGARVVAVDGKWSIETQGNAIGDLIAQGVSAIAMAPIDGVVAISWLERLNEAKIPVVAYSSQFGNPAILGPKEVYPGVFAYVNHDDIEAGGMSADIILPLFTPGRTTKVAIVQGAPGYSVNDQRVSGFKAALDKAGANYEVVADQPTDWSPESAQAVCQNIITANPDVEFIFALADPVALGCSKSVLAAGSSARIVSTTGGMAIGNAEILAGTILGSTCAKPATMARLAAKAAYEAATDPNAVAGKFIPYEMIPITKDNLADCPPEW